MAVKRLLGVMMVSILVTGCAATRGQDTMSQLQLRVGELERQVSMKDEEITNLRSEVKNLSDDRKTSRRDIETSSSSKGEYANTGDIIRVAVSAEDVQKALKGAGFYDGNIDGKVGARTKKAISEFQSSKGIKSDGIVGKQTWTELKQYLE